jgi:hypothetical protein
MHFIQQKEKEETLLFQFNPKKQIPSS